MNAKEGPAGKVRIDEIIGYHKKPEQFNISRVEHGSIYRLIITSDI